MITAVAMFYIVLSLGQQDVIRFLSEIESDAVERLLTNLLPTVYLCALLFVFFGLRSKFNLFGCCNGCDDYKLQIE